MLSQTRIPDPTDPTGESDVWRITFQTAAGTQSYVQVPERSYTADNVAEAIKHAAGEIGRIDVLELGHKDVIAR